MPMRRLRITVPPVAPAARAAFITSSLKPRFTIASTREYFVFAILFSSFPLTVSSSFPASCARMRKIRLFAPFKGMVKAMPLFALLSCSSLRSFSMRGCDRLLGTMLTKTLLSMLPRPSISYIFYKKPVRHTANHRFCAAARPDRYAFILHDNPLRRKAAAARSFPIQRNKAAPSEKKYTACLPYLRQS